MSVPFGGGGDKYLAEREYDLIRAVGRGDVSAFEQLIGRYRGPVLNFVCKYTGDWFGAEDIAQEVFWRVYRAAPGFEPRGRVATWIFKIAYNLSMNEVRREKRFRGAIDDIDNYEFPGREDDVARREREQEIMNAVRALPDKQRAALLLRVNEELSYAEIGSVLSISVAGVESLLFRARENLRKEFQRDHQKEK
jgi:RNA polymerase sigma-70 factor (ECF subfamily)